MPRGGRDWAARPLLTGKTALRTRSACHGLHMALVFFGLLGWIVPQTHWLIAHLIFIPGLLLTWQLNQCACPINNLETWLTTGRWRNPSNAEEGGFLRGVAARYLDLELSEATMNRIIYIAMVAVWGLSGLHLSLREVWV
jgi:hypothetical protein